MGQPTHRYDSSMIDGSIILSEEKTSETFLNLLDQEINLSGKILYLEIVKILSILLELLAAKKLHVILKQKM